LTAIYGGSRHFLIPAEPGGGRPFLYPAESGGSRPFFFPAKPGELGLTWPNAGGSMKTYFRRGSPGKLRETVHFGSEKLARWPRRRTTTHPLRNPCHRRSVKSLYNFTLVQNKCYLRQDDQQEMPFLSEKQRFLSICFGQHNEQPGIENDKTCLKRLIFGL
jgi:hypothetical protein